MKKHSRHFALVMLLFIAYPYVFQALHILNHDHIHTAANWSADSGNYHACSSQGHCDNPGGNKDKPGGSSFPGPYLAGVPEHTDHEDAHCPLCEHEFAKFSVKSLFHISFKDERFSLVNDFYYQDPSVLYTGHHRSFRAPPTVS